MENDTLTNTLTNTPVKPANQAKVCPPTPKKSISDNLRQTKSLKNTSENQLKKPCCAKSLFPLQR